MINGRDVACTHRVHGVRAPASTRVMTTARTNRTAEGVGRTLRTTVQKKKKKDLRVFRFPGYSVEPNNDSRRRRFYDGVTRRRNGWFRLLANTRHASGKRYRKTAGVEFEICKKNNRFIPCAIDTCVFCRPDAVSSREFRRDPHKSACVCPLFAPSLPSKNYRPADSWTIVTKRSFCARQ